MERARCMPSRLAEWWIRIAVAALVSVAHAQEQPAAAPQQEPPVETTVEPPVYRKVPDETPIDQIPDAAPEPDRCMHARRRQCTHFDLGLHGYLTSRTQLFGAQLGVGYEWFSLRGQVGPVINDGLVDRFDTVLLGPYFAGSVSGYFLRSERFEARAGLGVMALWLASISTELLYWAGTLGVAGAWYFAPPVGAFVELQLLPLSSERLDLGYAPLLLQLGVEVTL